MENYDFSGWATRNDLKCSDGRTILKDAFKKNDGMTVPLVWNHQHKEAENVLGHALLENRAEGVYTYGFFNDTPQGQHAKTLVQHGDVTALSIYANQLKQQGGNVLHGAIREVSLVLAGANPGAYIDSVISHGEESDEEAVIFTGEDIELFSEESEVVEHADQGDDEGEGDKEMANEKEKTVQDVVDSMTEEQKTVMYALIGQALEQNEGEADEEGDEEMKHNIFDAEENEYTGVLTHSDQEAILALAKSKSVGSLQEAIKMYAADENNQHLAHGIDEIETLFPEFKNLNPGAPEVITDDQGWVGYVMSKVHKSPFSRIRTRHADQRRKELEEEMRGLGYKKGTKKLDTGKIKLLGRTTDPQTVYIKDKLDRDDIVDITDFDVVEYNFANMKRALNEEVATAIMIGDGRQDGDAQKIDPTHIRPIWTDDDLYVIKADVDIAKAKQEIQGSDTSVHFGDNYIYAEAIITAALYAREQYKGKGGLDFFCTPHLLNVMLLARDLNGRRIYSSKADLVAALNVNSIQTVEQFEGKTRVDGEGESAKTKKLLGIFVNLAQDYSLGSTKGGEITRFQQFDIDYNQEKQLIETRLSGAMVNPYSAIVLEEPVTA